MANHCMHLHNNSPTTIQALGMDNNVPCEEVIDKLNLTTAKPFGLQITLQH